MKKILLVEDDSHVCSFINKGLSEEGYQISIAMDGQQGLDMATSNNYDLLILDIMLPSVNGLEMCKKIREGNPKIPILFLTALGNAENIVLGLESGADDYLAKPFKFIELLARVRTLIRRTDYQDTAPDKEGHIYQFADLELNDKSKEVFRDGMPISLTSTEYRLLLMFMTHPKRVLSRVEILDKVWGVNFDMGTNVVDVYVNYLRKKTEKYGNGKLIHTVIGMGYVLKENQ